MNYNIAKIFDPKEVITQIEPEFEFPFMNEQELFILVAVKRVCDND